MGKLPGINHLDAVRALQKAGFRLARQGKHIVMTDGVRILTVPRHVTLSSVQRSTSNVQGSGFTPDPLSLMSCALALCA